MASLPRIAMEAGVTGQDTTDSGESAALFSNVVALLEQQYRLTYASAVAGTPGAPCPSCGCAGEYRG